MQCTKALSLPTWVIFVSPIVLLFRGQICLLRIFLENSRGPIKKVFDLDRTQSKRTRNIMAHGRTNFQPFKVFLSPKITFLDFKKERRYII